MPAFLLGAGGWDLHCQSLAVRLFSEQFWQGEPYPRWLLEMFAGDGSPIFFYYPPLTYFITALFHSLSALDAFGYYPMAASALLAVFVAGITCYVWLKDETGSDKAALCGALLYISVPSNMAQNFYQLLLFSSVWAYAFLPLLMLFAKRLAAGRPFAVLGFALSLGLLVLCNLPTTLVFGPVAVAYCLFHFTKVERARQSLRLGFALALGFGLSAIFLMPSLFYMGFASVDLAWTRAQMARAPYITSLKGTQFTVYIVCWFVAAALTVFYFRSAEKSKQRFFFSAVCVVSLLLMLPVSAPLWELVPILYIVQMSERFFTVVALSFALLGALTLPRTRIVSLWLLPVYAVITFIVAMNTRETVESFKARDPGNYYAYTLNVDQYALFLPTHSLMGRFGTPEGLKEVMANREKIFITRGDAVVSVSQWKPREILLHYKATRDSTLQVRQFNYPGWRAFLHEADLELRRDEKSGEIQFDVPTGEADITLKLTALLPEVAGKLISMLSLGVLLLLGLMELQKKARASR